jgi:predicted RNA-binding protein with PUA domain
VTPSDTSQSELSIEYVSKSFGIDNDEIQSILIDGDIVYWTSLTELIKFNTQSQKWQTYPSLLGADQLEFKKMRSIK